MAAGILAEFARPAQSLSILVALALPVLSTAPADAAEPSGPTTKAGARTTNGAERRVVVGILGGLDTSEQVALAALLGPELELSNLVLSLEVTTEPVSAFIARGRGSPRALLVAVVDARKREGIELYVVDPARGRAMLRRLPGGLEANRASLEAIASIVMAAAQALAEGPRGGVAPGRRRDAREARAEAGGRGEARACRDPTELRHG
jgi:hypothetical protein